MLALPDRDRLRGLVDEQHRGGHQQRIEFLLAARVGAHCADVGAGPDPRPLHQRLLRRRDGDQDVGAGGHRLAVGGLELQPQLLHQAAERRQLVGRRIPGADLADRAHGQRRAQLVLRLHAGADQAQHAGVGPRQVLDGDRAGRAGAYAGQVVGADQRAGASGVGVEQQGRGLVVAQALGQVVRPVAAGLQAEDRGRRIATGLDAEHCVPVADQLAHHRIVAGLAPRHGSKRLLHRLDGGFDADQGARVLFGNDDHAMPCN